MLWPPLHAHFTGEQTDPETHAKGLAGKWCCLGLSPDPSASASTVYYSSIQEFWFIHQVNEAAVAFRLTQRDSLP